MDGGKTTRTDRSRRTDRGASLVEFAFIMPILFMLILGMITGGISLSQQNSVENAVREGTRYGAVYPDDAVAGYLQAVFTQVEEAATGDLADGVEGKYICVAYISDAGARTKLEQVPNQNAPTQSTNAECFSDGRGNGEARVQVLARRKGKINGVFFTMKPSLESKSVTRYER
jgi:hypothetical protein